MERWQCARNPPCCREVWDAPEAFRFTVVADGPLLRAPADAIVLDGFGRNHPRCRRESQCSAGGAEAAAEGSGTAPTGGYARPNVVFFDDDSYIHTPEHEATEDRYRDWLRRVTRLAKGEGREGGEGGERGGRRRLVVVEIGCGVEVPSARSHIDCVLGDAGNSPTVDVVRINPSTELLDFEVAALKREGARPPICVVAGALEGLVRIDEQVELMARSAAAGTSGGGV